MGQSDFRNDKLTAIFMVNGRDEWKKRRKKHVTELLCHAQICRFTDLWDRIYAFMGLADPGYAIVPDYQIDMPTALRLACKRIIIYESKLNVLCCCIGCYNADEYARREIFVPGAQIRDPVPVTIISSITPQTAGQSFAPPLIISQLLPLFQKP